MLVVMCFANNKRIWVAKKKMSLLPRAEIQCPFCVLERVRFIEFFLKELYICENSVAI